MNLSLLNKKIKSWTHGYVSAMDRFWGLVDVSDIDGCWNWYGNIGSNGYGKIQIFHSSYLTHRISWIIHFGFIPKNMHILHHCDNKICMNPEHLFVGTHQDNMDDKLLKGRQAKGEKQGLSKLTTKDVLRIMELRGKESPINVAGMFDVSDSSIHDIYSGRSWSWVEQ